MFIPLYDKNALIIIPFQRVTVTLIVINVIAFIYQSTLPDGLWADITYSAGLKPAEWLGYEELVNDSGNSIGLFSWITHMFLHGSFMHLLGNMLFLWVFGDNIEDSMGHLRFMVFYLLSGFAAALAHALSDVQSVAPMIGASGAIAGIMGAYLVLHPRVKVLVLLFSRLPLRLPAMWLLVGWLLVQFISLGNQNVAWWAHIGGFITGAVLIIFFRYKQIPLFDQRTGDEEKIHD